MLEAFNIIEQYCNRLIEHAKQLDKPEYVHSLHPNIRLDRVLMLGSIISHHI